MNLESFLRRLLFNLITLVVVVTFNFFLFRIVPGDPVAMISSPRMRPETRELIREQYGLDKPLWLNFQAMQEEENFSALFDSQFYYYLKNITQGNLGLSFRQKAPVAELIGARVGPTVLLILAGQIIGILFGTIIGIIAAWKARSKFDAAALFIGLFGGYITLGVTYTTLIERWLDIGKHLVLPASTMALLLFGAYVLVVRNSTLEVLSEDYILTAKAKGLSPIRVLWKHALKNASLPLVTVIALDLGAALGGAIQIETIFSWPGVGRLMFEAIAQRDYPVLQGVFLLLAISVIAANFLADLTYSLLDPRVEG